MLLKNKCLGKISAIMCTEHQHLNFVRFVTFIALTVLFQEHQSVLVNAAPASPTSEHSAEPPSPSYIDDYISKHQSQKSPAKMSENKCVTKRSSENVREVNNEIDENGAKIHSFLLKNKETKDREDKNIGTENAEQKSHASAGDIENDTNAKVDKNQNTETLSGRTTSEDMADKESPATDANNGKDKIKEENDEDSNGKQSEKSDLNSDKVEEKHAKNETEKQSLEKSSEGGKNSNSTKKTIWPSTSTIKKLTRQRRVENEGETSQSEENNHEIKANKTPTKSDDGADVESATPDPIPKHQTAMTKDGTQTDDDEQIPSPVTTKKVQKSRENEHSVETFADVDNEPRPVTLTTTTPYTPTSSTTATETASEGAVVEAQIKPSTRDEQKDTDTMKKTDKIVEKEKEKEKGSESEANKEAGKEAETNEGGEIGEKTKSEGNKGNDSTMVKETETEKSETAINSDKETEAKTEKESNTATTIGQKAARRGDKSLGTVDDEKNSESNADEAEKSNKNVGEKSRKKEDDNRKTDDEGKASKNDDVKDKTQKYDNKSSVEKEKTENSAERNSKNEKNASGKNSVENTKVGEENERDKNGNREQKPIAIEQRQTEEKMKTDGKTGDVTVTSDSKKTSGKRHHEDLTSTEEEKEHAAVNEAGKDESSMLPGGNKSKKLKIKAFNYCN